VRIGDVRARRRCSALTLCFSIVVEQAPVSIFAQNNGVISITRCANRFAGYLCSAILILFGVLAKISGVFLAIPAPVLGGVTTFLFSSVAVSGLKVLSLTAFTRRDRMILASALALGLGNLLVDDWSSYIFTYSGPNAALKGFMNSIIIVSCLRSSTALQRLTIPFGARSQVLSTPFLIAGIIASLLNALLPADPDSAPTHADEEEDELERAEAAKPARVSSSVDDDVKQA
jgi:uric acid-xanthine permease